MGRMREEDRRRRALGGGAFDAGREVRLWIMSGRVWILPMSHSHTCTCLFYVPLKNVIILPLLFL